MSVMSVSVLDGVTMIWGMGGVGGGNGDAEGDGGWDDDDEFGDGGDEHERDLKIRWCVSAETSASTCEGVDICVSSRVLECVRTFGVTAGDDVRRALDAAVGHAYAGVFAVAPQCDSGDELVLVAAREDRLAAPVVLVGATGVEGTAGVEESEWERGTGARDNDRGRRKERV